MAACIYNYPRSNSPFAFFSFFFASNPCFSIARKPLPSALLFTPLARISAHSVPARLWTRWKTMCFAPQPPQGQIVRPYRNPTPSPLSRAIISSGRPNRTVPMRRWQRYAWTAHWSMYIKCGSIKWNKIRPLRFSPVSAPRQDRETSKSQYNNGKIAFLAFVLSHVMQRTKNFVCPLFLRFFLSSSSNQTTKLE